MKIYKPVFSKIDAVFLFVSILLTIVSQHPSLLKDGTGRYFLLIWIFPFARLLFLKKIILDKIIKIPILIYTLWLVFLLVAEIFSGNKYLNTPNFINLTLMLIMMLIGYFSASKITEVNFNKILFWTSIIGGLILCVGIYNYAFIAKYDLLSRGYVYGAKNSVSNIIFSCLIFSLLLPSSSKLSNIKYPISVFMIYMILVLKSRATVIGFVVFATILIIKSKNRKLQFFSALIVTTIILVIISSNSLRTILIDGIILGGREASNLDDVSSGRMSMIQKFPTLFKENIFFGRGSYFIESFPLATIIQVGITGSAILFSFIFWVFKIINSQFEITNKLNLSVIILFYVLLLNSLFEEQAPFGPGAKCFLFWLPFGFVLYKRNYAISPKLRKRNIKIHYFQK